MEFDQERFQAILFDGRLHESPAQNSTLNQERPGLKKLYSFLYQGNPFSDLSPFSLDISSRFIISKNRTNPGYTFFMGGENKYLHLTVPQDIISKNIKVLWAFPRSLNRGTEPYYWLDFYAPGSVSNEPFGGSHLLPNNLKNKTNFKNWHNIEEQLLADYISGVNGLMFADLSPFTLDVINKGRFYKYSIDRKHGISLSIGDNDSFDDSDILRFVPRTDDQKIYEWVDILKVDKTLPEDNWQKVSSYRISLQEHRLYSEGWYGAIAQLYIDWMRGVNGITFDNLRPMRSKVTLDGETINLFASKMNGHKWAFYFTRGKIEPGLEVIAFPKQDDHGLYQWLELYRYDSVTKTPVGEVVASGRITPEGVKVKDWSGIEKQLLKDYTTGKVSFDYLKPIKFSVGQGKDMLSLWKEDGRKMYLVLSRYFGLHTGDILSLNPDDETESGCSFILSKDGTLLARYLYIKAQNKFVLDEILLSISKPDLQEAARLRGLWRNKAERQVRVSSDEAEDDLSILFQS